MFSLITFMPPNMPPDYSCDPIFKKESSAPKRQPHPYELRGSASERTLPVAKGKRSEIFTPYPSNFKFSPTLQAG